MKTAFFFALLCLGAFAQENDIPTGCSLCNIVVDGIESLIAEKLSKDDLLNQLANINNNICPKIPSNSYLSSEECSSYVTLYGPYFIDMLLSSTQPDDVCSSLGFCQNSNSEVFDIVFPRINDKIVEYDVKQSTLVLGQEYGYKIFLGSPSFLVDERLSICLNKYEKDICGFSMAVTNKTNYNNLVVAPPAYNNGTAKIYHPGRGVWYYFTVSVNEKLDDSLPACTYSIKSTIKNIPKIVPIGPNSMHANIVPIILLPLLCLSVILCCCCCARRRCKSRCRMQKAQDVQLEVMEAAPQTAALPVGYYYVPVGPGQYVQVPQNSQPVVYPEYTVQQE